MKYILLILMVFSVISCSNKVINPLEIPPFLNETHNAN